MRAPAARSMGGMDGVASGAVPSCETSFSDTRDLVGGYVCTGLVATALPECEFQKIQQLASPNAANGAVRRGDCWVPAAELPWIQGMVVERKRDGRRLFWITLVLMLLGLAGVLWIRSHAALVARKSGALPPGGVRAVPASPW